MGSEDARFKIERLHICFFKIQNPILLKKKKKFKIQNPIVIDLSSLEIIGVFKLNEFILNIGLN